MSAPRVTEEDLDRAIRAVRLLGDSALPILRRIVRELDRQKEDRRLLDLVSGRAAGRIDE